MKNSVHELDDYRRGKMYITGLGGLPQDFAEAMKCFRRAADEQNHPGAQLTLGMLLLIKFIVTKDDEDYEEARKWLYRAEDQGFPEAVRLKLRYMFERDPSRYPRVLRDYLDMSGMSWEDWKEFFEQIKQKK